MTVANTPARLANGTGRGDVIASASLTLVHTSSSSLGAGLVNVTVISVPDAKATWTASTATAARPCSVGSIDAA